MFGVGASLQSKVLLLFLWAFCFLVNFKKDAAALVSKDRIKDVAALTNGTVKQNQAVHKPKKKLPLL